MAKMLRAVAVARHNRTGPTASMNVRALAKFLILTLIIAVVRAIKELEEGFANFQMNFIIKWRANGTLGC
jgi:hypothetical protein